MRPMQLGGGDLRCTLPAGWRLADAHFCLSEGLIHIACRGSDGTRADLSIGLGVDDDVAWLTWHGLPRAPELVLIPSATWIQSELTQRGIPAPQTWHETCAGGMCQTLPADGCLAIAWNQRESGATLSVRLGSAGEAADAVIAATRMTAMQQDAGGRAATVRQWWQHYADSVATIRIPDPVVQQAWDLGLLKQAGLTPAHGEAATLQGPFMESYQIPPWSNDYHFNINIELIYGACLVTNCPRHMEPLWRLIRTWLPALRANAERFFGCADALLLPHAVDDRCQAVGSFWTGMIDQACTAWMAQLAWQHYRATMDQEILNSVAWPLLTGAFNGYWAMLESVAGTLSLPVSVSPEFGGCRSDAWGCDASFQLAACHALAQILPQAAAVLGHRIDPRWQRVRTELPPYTIVRGPRLREYPERQVDRIGLWQDRDLPESHRHHSHLAAIHPFRTIDPADPQHAAIIQESLAWWVLQGPGAWSGWSLPWAASINIRCGRADAAVAWMHWWHHGFTNVGGGTLHDADMPGVSRLHSDEPEIMQMDAAMGMLSAIADLLVQSVGAEIRLFPGGLPRRWRYASFDRIRVDGGFLIGATVADATVSEVRVTATVAGAICLHHGFLQGCRWAGGACGDARWRHDFAAGERIVLRPR